MKLQRKNNLSLAARIVATVVTFALVLLCVMSLTIPPHQLYFEKNVVSSDDVAAVLSIEDIIDSNDCQIDSNGKITVTGADPHIVFSATNLEIQAVKLNLKNPIDEQIVVVLYYDDGEGFSEDKIIEKCILPSENNISFNLDKNEFQRLRIDFDGNCDFKNIELHYNAADIVKVPVSVPLSRYIIAIFVSIIIAAVFFFVDGYIYPISEKIKNYYLKNSKEILVDVCLILFSIIVSIGIEFLLGHLVFGISSLGSYFNIYRYFFVVCVVCAIGFLIKGIVKRTENTEKLFAILMLLVGISMILCSPFGHICWDFDSHTRFVVQQTSIGDSYITVADNAIITNKKLYLPQNTAFDNLQNIENINSIGNKIFGIYSGDTTIAHVQIGLAVAVSRFLGADYVTGEIFGRIANLAVYVAVCYFAMKKLKSGKMILATIAFFPTNLFLATNYAYDAWVTAFIMLGTAYFISEMQQPNKKITTKDTVIMNLAFILGCIPKLVYMPIMILPFFMVKVWKDKPQRKKYFSICVSMFALTLAFLLIKSFFNISSGGDMRGGTDISTIGQIKFILTEPFTYTKILLTFLKKYLSIGMMNEYISFFAYMGKGIMANVFIFMIMFTTLTDKNDYDKFKGRNLLRIISMVAFFGIICLVATALYISFTPVGSAKIAGCQPRYIAPMLLPLLITVANPGIRLKINKRIYNTASLTILSFAAFADIAVVLLPRLM